MITCPNCGTQNEPGARFCAECGADLRSLAPASQPPQSPPTTSDLPPQYELGGPTQPGAGWPSGDFAPPPEKKRRTWLWIVLGVIGGCLILCCALSVWASTDSGEERINDWLTRIADYGTETAE